MRVAGASMWAAGRTGMVYGCDTRNEGEQAVIVAMEIIVRIAQERGAVRWRSGVYSTRYRILRCLRPALREA